MRAFRCGLHILFCSIVPVMLTGCGDGSTTPSSPFGADCTQTTVLQGSGSLPAYTADVESEVVVTVRAVACDARDHAACWPVLNSFRVPLRLLREGQRELRFTLPLELPR